MMKKKKKLTLLMLKILIFNLLFKYNKLQKNKFKLKILKIFIFKSSFSKMPKGKGRTHGNSRFTERTQARDGSTITTSVNKKLENDTLKHQQAWAAYRLGKGPKPKSLPKSGSPTKDQHLVNRIKKTRSRLENTSKKLAEADSKVSQLDEESRVLVSGKKLISERNRFQESVKKLTDLLKELDPEFELNT